MSVLDKSLRATMPDGSVSAVSVKVIAEDRARHYVHEFGGDLERSMAEDTVPLFDEDSYEVEDWASNNMNWSDVQPIAICVAPPSVDFDDGWANGEKEVA